LILGDRSALPIDLFVVGESEGLNLKKPIRKSLPLYGGRHANSSNFRLSSSARE
jgi:hypothetical protein